MAYRNGAEDYSRDLAAGFSTETVKVKVAVKTRKTAHLVTDISLSGYLMQSK